jgi:hypothetical protein
MIRVSARSKRSDVQWDRVFESVADKHPDTDCGVFFCGPAGLGDTLKGMCGKYTSPMGCRFYFGKEVSESCICGCVELTGRISEFLGCELDSSRHFVPDVRYTSS